MDAADGDVAVLHLLGVRPSARGSGVGAQLVRGALDIAQLQHKKALRLNALEYCGRQRLWADNIGWTQFCYYEWNL